MPITNNDIKIYDATEFIRTTASRIKTGSKFNTHTIRDKGAGQDCGYFGEYAFDRWCSDVWLSAEYIGDNKGLIDFLVYYDKRRCVSVDVKAKARNVRVDVTKHEAHVETRLEGQQGAPQIYVFSSVVGHLIELIGWQWSSEWWKVCRRVSKGEADGPHVEKADAGKMFYSHLRSMDELEAGLMGINRASNTR